ncbi:hypothetical protein KPH14_007624 [Odynerus spinipes]|uniref:Uncharacterized protein n=1 Tax=Odynerus spinipes TaxID=1348599 RepID=A0AAD9RHN9_9HYME|nr:hypothetical protein KPH14_007624 [Odynerus spinipes]
MLSRLRLPANQFSKCLVQQTSRAIHGVYTTPNRRFLPSGILQRIPFGMFMKGTRDFRLLRRFRTNDSMEQFNSKKTDNLDASRSLIFLKNTEISNMLDEMRHEESNPIYTTPISLIMRPMSKISSIKDIEITQPDDVETELYDVQYIMDPSYQEVLYQRISQRPDIPLENYDTSGPINWQIVR